MTDSALHNAAARRSVRSWQRNGHGPMSDLSPSSGQERTLTNRRAPHAYVWVDVKSL